MPDLSSLSSLLAGGAQPLCLFWRRLRSEWSCLPESQRMGSDISKAYEWDHKNATATGGHICAWRIFPATSRKTGEKCSLFVLNKDEVRSKVPKADVEQFLGQKDTRRTTTTTATNDNDNDNDDAKDMSPLTSFQKEQQRQRPPRQQRQ